MEKDRPKIKIDEVRILDMVLTALKAREQRFGLFAGNIIPPERSFIEIIKKYEEERGIDGFAANALFFFITTLFADNSERQCALAARPVIFKPNAWIFRPEIVITKPEGEVKKAAFDLIRPGYNKTALDRWHHNAQVLCDKYQGQVRNFYAKHNFDAPGILEELVGPKKKATHPGFHRFGPKLGRLLLQWTHQYGLAELRRINEIGVPVDFQVARLVIQTGGINLEEPTHKHWVLDKTLVHLFTSLCTENSLSAQHVSETLWLIGNRCCNNYRHDLCPLTDLCDKLISREPIDTDGLFDPKDIGRHKTWAIVQAERRRERQILSGQIPLAI